ncbi:MAG: general secretion pathway protein GspB [Rubrivivax sp.]
MSYILDALRRADAERRRAQAPALQQVTQGPAWGEAAPTSAPPRRIWIVGSTMLALSVLAALAWRALGPGTAPAPAAAASAADAMAAAPLPAPLAMPQPAPPPPLPPAPVAMPAPAPAPPPVAAPVAAPAVTPAPVATAPAAPAVPRPAPVPAPPAAAPAAPAPEEPLPAAALPEAQRARVAALAIGGAVHSQDRAQSFVIVAGQPLREGQPAGAGITVERIEPRALLLRVDGRLVRWPL